MRGEETVLPSGKVLSARETSGLPELPEAWRRWGKELKLRKTELERLEYLVWLRAEREKAIQGMVQSGDQAPAHLLYESILPLIREEIRQAEGANAAEQPGKTQLRPEAMSLIRRGHLPEALALVEQFVLANAELAQWQDELIHLQSELAHLNESERKGLLPFDTIRTGRNQLLHALMGILDDIETT